MGMKKHALDYYQCFSLFSINVPSYSISINKCTLHGIVQTRNVVGEDQPTFYLELSIQITSQSSNNDLTLHIQIDLIKCENLKFLNRLTVKR